MKITLEMILTLFFQECPHQPQNAELTYTSGNQVISGIQLLPRHPKELSAEYLYVTDEKPEDIHIQCPQNGTILCFCDSISGSGDAPTDFPQNHTTPDTSSIIQINTDLELADAFNQLLKCYNIFLDWERSLDFAVFRNAGFQELIDLSAEIITFPVLIYDPALKLLAWSQNQSSLNDHIFQAAIANGYLDVEAVKYFDKTHIFEQMDNTGMAAGMVDQFREHDDYAIAINIHNELAVYCVMLDTGDCPRSYAEQLFRIFCDSVQNLLEKQHTDFLRNRSVTDYFLMDLLDNPKTPKEQIRERLAYNDLDYEGNFVVITIHSDITRKPSENYFIQILRNNMINCRIFPYKDHIVILYLLPKFREVSYKDYFSGLFGQILKDFLNRRLTLYFSKPFTTIGQFADAWIQAENVCRLLHGKTDTMYCFYEDYWLADLFLMNTSGDLAFSYCEPAVRAMLENKSKKSRQQLQILYEYLNCDRKLTEAANKLGMHRNNVIYHIKQMEECYHLDLDDPEMRLKLLLSFELLKYTKK